MATKVRMGGKPRDMRAVWMEEGLVKMIDQRLLPGRLDIFEARNHGDVARSIKDMVVRGAPTIGATAAYGMAQAALRKADLSKVAEALGATRPTANDLFHAIDFMLAGLKDPRTDPVRLADGYANRIIEECRAIGLHGEKIIPDGGRVLTHCNAGALATVDVGTALAPIRIANENGKRPFVFVDETRPLLQGMRLTAWELVQEGIEHRIIADNAAGYFMARGEVDVVIVGADRMALNGDFANKIGTYEKAVLAAENGIPFYAAVPSSTFDPRLKTGKEIVIEERAEDEVLGLYLKGLAPEGARARNPAFDVTPSRFVTGVITGKGILKPSELGSLAKARG